MNGKKNSTINMEIIPFVNFVILQLCDEKELNENGKIKSLKRRADDLGLLKQMGVTVSWQGTVIT